MQITNPLWVTGNILPVWGRHTHNLLHNDKNETDKTIRIRQKPTTTNLIQQYIQSD